MKTAVFLAAGILLACQQQPSPSGNATPSEEDAKTMVLDNPFFAFDNGTGRGVIPPQKQADMLVELGYAGIGYTGGRGIPEMLTALDRHQLKMFSIYIGAKIGPDGPSYDPSLPQAIQDLAGTPLAGGQDIARSFTQNTPPELSADIMDKGIILAGGGSLLKNLDERLREETGLPVAHCEEPISAVVRGTGMMLTNIDLLRKIAID